MNKYIFSVLLFSLSIISFLTFPQTNMDPQVLKYFTLETIWGGQWSSPFLHHLSIMVTEEKDPSRKKMLNNISI